MDSGTVSGWDYATQRPVQLVWQDGQITAIQAAPAPTRPNIWIAPALFDIQVNGYAGVDFQQDQLTTEDLLHAVAGLRSAGCAGFLLTLITDEWAKLTNRLRHFVALRAASAELKSAIVGWHIEGPFLSERPGFHGAHEPSLMLDPRPEHIHELRALTGNDPLLLTLAPERHGAIEVIRIAASLGIRISLGHSDASARQLAEAVEAGATLFTHLGNGCPRELDRHDNILWRVCQTPGLTPSFIPDQIHVSPAPFCLLHRALAGRTCYTTDAMAAAGASPGKFTFGKMILEVGADQIVRQPGRTNFAGSALQPVEGVFRAASMLNCPWQETWPRLSEVPASLMGLEPRLAVGQPATFCVLETSEAGKLISLRTYWKGRGSLA